MSAAARQVCNPASIEIQAGEEWIVIKTLAVIHRLGVVIMVLGISSESPRNALFAGRCRTLQASFQSVASARRVKRFTPIP